MTTQPSTTARRDVLFRDEAVERSGRVDDVHYELELDLVGSTETYAGRAAVEFMLRDSDRPLFLDFTGTVLSARLGGRPVELDHRDHRLWLPGDLLREHNRLEVEYRNAYDASGDGFHRFVDPEDGAEYAYSNLEPFSAHRLFPCFDQPDIKATFALTVTAPQDHRVVSAVPAADVGPMPRGAQRHRFETTARFSTYLFPVISGPFERIVRTHRGLPLALYGRRSMLRELEHSAEELFDITAAGLDYYADLFGRAFPFTKYDQLFVPEFNAGAMENVGAVTFNDRFLFRDPPTYGQRLVRGEVVLHELAHMWFGDLVTMRWWDDLWLNETFATYLSYRCLADATRFEDAWQVFNGQMRPAAYRQDQLATSHAIATPVEHTDQAIGNFDAITYEKGAAVIKQLVAALGDEAFRAGLASYFERHAWSNATLTDLLASLGEAAGRSLDGWAEVWLQTPSLDTIGARWTARDGRISAMELVRQSPEQYPAQRSHATQLGLVSGSVDAGGLEVSSIPVVVEEAATPVPAAVGRREPLFVYPNHGDHDYALARLDPVSLDFALEHLPALPDALLRQQTWSTLWEMVRDARLSSADYLAAVRRFAPTEADRGLVQAILDRATAALSRYVPASSIAEESAALVSTALDAMRNAGQQDLCLIWARAATAMATRTEDIGQLLGLVDGGWSIEGFEPDQQMRWSLAVKAVAHGLDDAATRLADEAERDRSDRGQRSLIQAEAARPDPDAKQAAWERINGEGYGSDYLTRSAMQAFQWLHQRELLLRFRPAFFARVEGVHATRDHAFAESYVRWLIPDRWAEPDVLDQIARLRRDLGDTAVLLRRQLDEIADDLDRTIRVRAFAAAAR